MADNSAFISYRRDTGYPWARLVWDELREHSVNAFLDVESLREAGRFDQRILKQIAARPYFLAVIADGSLDRCVSETDWVRREMEHAIDNGRIIVPLFIAPFEPSRFPEHLPPRIREALANSSGVTFYSQFMPAALEQLISLVEPVDLTRVGLTDDDARFEMGAQRRVESQQRPELPPTQAIAVTPSDPDTAEPTDTDAMANALPASEATSPDVPPPPWYHAPEATHFSPRGPTPTVDRTDQPGPGERPSPSMSERPELTERSRPRRRLIAIALGIAVVLAVGGIVGLSIVGDDDGGRTDLAESTTNGSADVDDPTTEASTAVSDPERSTVPEVTRLTTDDDNAYVRVGESLVSENGRHELVMTTAGQLELRTDGVKVWAPQYFSAAVPGAIAVLQEDDGNFVVYSSEAVTEVLWTIGVLAGRDVALEIREDSEGSRPGYVAVFDRDGNDIWRQPARSSSARSQPVTESTTPATTPPSPTETGATSTTATSPSEITVATP